jgi:hypothetical protein
VAVDTFQKRMSATFVGCPWRGPLVDATDSGFTKNNRYAAAFYYGGFSSAAFLIDATTTSYLISGVDVVLTGSGAATGNHLLAIMGMGG